jgi:2-alkyl-3-oxoalkanoate reductase
MKALVTGGGGFLGSAIARLLRERGDQVRSFSRGKHAQLSILGVEEFNGDLADPAAVLEAVKGCDIVFHVAAKAGIWGSYEEFYRANVTGTQNVVAACLANKVERLVYTSSPSVVFDGSDVEGGDESLPYPASYEAHYPATKAIAEQIVMDANSASLATVSLRPHLIWGPGDNHLVPRIVAKGRAGKLRRLGSSPCLVDTVYIDNAAQAHLDAADRLEPGSAISGKTYFISNGEPLPLWEMVDRILAAAGVAPVSGSLNPGVAYRIGTACEFLWKFLCLSGEPPMTRFMASELSHAHWFDISAARQELGYQPQVTIDEGLKRLKASFDKVKR